MCASVDDSLDLEQIDNLCSVVDLQKFVSNADENVVNANLTLDKLKTICQELLLKLHPDKKSSSKIRDIADVKDNKNCDLEKVLSAWKFLSKYPVDDENILIRRLFARQHQLTEQETNSTTKPLWKIVVLESFTPSGKTYHYT